MELATLELSFHVPDICAPAIRFFIHCARQLVYAKFIIIAYQQSVILIHIDCVELACLSCQVVTSQFVILQNDVIAICRGVLNTPDPQIYLGLMIGIRASPGFDLTIFSIFYPILAFSL